MVKIFNHPLINIKLTVLRDEKTNHTDFRKNLNEIASLMVYEILRNYHTSQKSVITPNKIEHIGSDFEKEIVIVPILRAGIGMVEGIQNLIPQARIGHIGLYRDEKTMKASEYFYKMPNVAKDSFVMVVDPMLATGGSAFDAISRLKKDGYTNISLISLVGVQEGIDKINSSFKDVSIFLAALDEKLNSKGYIVPGLGDAGDRIFGTK
ncbi:MAG: uracil phosphoribosyltransferase [Metamycoplasmataceae bacterium]